MDFDSVVDMLKKGIKDGAALSIEKIEEVSRIGKLKIEEFTAKRKIERNFIDMGERVFELIQDKKEAEIAADILVKSLVANIIKLQEELDVITEKMEEEHSGKKAVVDDDEITGI